MSLFWAISLPWKRGCQASRSSVWACCTVSSQGVGSRNAVAEVLSWAHRNPGLNSLRQHLCSSKSWRPGHLSKLYQPPFLPPSSYVAMLMSGISPGGMAKEGFEADGWRWRIAGASLFLLPIAVVPLVLVDGHFADGLPAAVTHGMVMAVAPLGLVCRMHLLTGSPVMLAERWVLNCIKKSHRCCIRNYR